MLVNSSTADDAGVYRWDKNHALVQTVDFFTPIVDDPLMYGQIAAANALSDIYAMGGRPLTALNLLGIPDEIVPPAIVHQILRGGAVKLKEAGCALIGGHTIRNPEPIYGLAVTGLVSPRNLLTNAAARPGDILVLTKPLGTGIVTTGIKRGTVAPTLARRSIQVMRCLNRVGAELAERQLVRAATDVTGFGLLGHLGALCRASGVGAEVSVGQLPVINQQVYELIAQDCIPGGSRQNLNYASTYTDWGKATPAQKALLSDAQTSGGLLLAIPKRKLNQVLALLKTRRSPCAAVIGEIVKSAKSHIWIRP